jgi:ubiquinone/menaquinone biosynthesis C-methylase UbiE
MKTVVALLAIAAAAFCQAAKDANQAYSDPNTRSKIASTLVDEGRDVRQKPKELIAALGLKPGMAVADVGTGAGYMLPHLSAAVGPQGKVYAEDVFPDFLDAAKKRGAKLTNVEYVLGDFKSAKLPKASVDVALVLDAYHHFDYPQPMLASLREALKPGGRMVVVEYHKNEKAMPNGRALEHIRATKDEFMKEIEGFGWRAVDVREFLPEVQWLGVFEPR